LCSHALAPVRVIFASNTERLMNCVIQAMKEFIVYKLFEMVYPYHFKTRRLSLEFTDNSFDIQILYLILFAKAFENVPT